MSYSKEEVEKFSAMSNDWWNPFGQMKMLHKFNPIRLNYIQKYSTPCDTLDFGCGAGILTEGLYDLGYNITAIDPSDSNIEVAKLHAKEKNILYYNQDEFIVNNDKKFDLICALEVLEHVENLDEFFAQINSLAKQNARVIFSTINRNIKSIICAKYIAEYALNLVPKGTHDYRKFLKPSEIANKIEPLGFKCIGIQGIKFNPFIQEFSYSKSIDMNYFITFEKC